MVVILFARGDGSWIPNTDLPQVHDIRNATSLLYGYTSCNQREQQVLISPDGTLAWQARSRTGLDEIGNEMQKVLGKARGLLTGLELPEPKRAEILDLYHNGQLGELEILAMKLSYNKALKDFALELYRRIEADRTERMVPIRALFEAGKTEAALARVPAFLAAYPKSKEAKEIAKLIMDARKNKDTRPAVEAYLLYDKILGEFIKNGTKLPKQFQQLRDTYPASYFAQLVDLFWVKNNNVGVTFEADKKNR